MKAVIDRFENGVAVLELEDKTTLPFPAAALPHGAREGDVLQITAEIDRAETESRRRKIEKRMNGLFLD